MNDGGVMCSESLVACVYVCDDNARKNWPGRDLLSLIAQQRRSSYPLQLRRLAVPGLRKPLLRRETRWLFRCVG